VNHYLFNALGMAVAAIILAGSRSACADTEPCFIIEDFSSDPVVAGWRIFGDTNLFLWNAQARELDVTWDSSKPNSYFFHPLTPVSQGDNFSLSFELRLRDIAVGTTPDKPHTFGLAVGLLNLQQATNSAFRRGSGFDSPNLVEMDYFPDSGFGATVSPTIISSNMQFATSLNLLELTTNDVFRFNIGFDEDDGEMTGAIFRNGQYFALLKRVLLNTNFSGFRVDAIAIMSYSDEGQDPQYAGSLLVHGAVDNLFFAACRPTMDLGLTGRFVNGQWQMQFVGRAGWSYSLYRTRDFLEGRLVATHDSATDGPVTLADTNAPPDRAFYHIFGIRP